MTTSPFTLEPGLLDRLSEPDFSASRHADLVARAWRSLSDGARTLVGVSGGADSLALLLSLRRVSDGLVAVYIRHDQRPREETDRELDVVRRVASELGITFDSCEISAGDGNIESSFRNERYRALSELGERHECPFVATGHHADDQLETIIHALIRGAGVSGLGGMQASRPIDDRRMLIRPMLEITHDDACEICRCAAIGWFEDPTNEHLDRTRARLRSRVMPVLRSLNPSASLNASRSAAQLREAARALETVASEALRDATRWDRDHLASLPDAVLTTALRRRILVATGGAHADTLSWARLNDVVRAVRDQKDHLRSFHFAGDITIEVHAHRVEFVAPTI
ncbi:MAG: tRNA lysidine(34) synthetase TilS [Phycisphaerales bacterium JB043]